MEKRNKWIIIILLVVILIFIYSLYKNNKNIFQKNEFLEIKNSEAYEIENYYFKKLGSISIEDFYNNVDNNINSEYSSISVDTSSDIINGKYIKYNDGITSYFLPKYVDGIYYFSYEIIGNGNNVYFEGNFNDDDFICDTEFDISDENKKYICNDIENKIYTFIDDSNKEIFEKNIISKPYSKSNSKVKIIFFIILVLLSLVTYLLYRKVNSDSI